MYSTTLFIYSDCRGMIKESTDVYNNQDIYESDYSDSDGGVPLYSQDCSDAPNSSDSSSSDSADDSDDEASEYSQDSDDEASEYSQDSDDEASENSQDYSDGSDFSESDFEDEQSDLKNEIYADRFYDLEIFTVPSNYCPLCS
jgi:hypothetical protein